MVADADQGAPPTGEPKICEPGGQGLAFPLFQAEHDLPDYLRGFLYTGILVYLFVGVSIIADKFMSAVEKITSKKLRVRSKSTGRIITVLRWNDTVANLTLLALGSSAPEIMLSIVDTLRLKFHSGVLGPQTIVGSAAFNLFMIIGVCVVAIPSPEVRRIKANGVFLVTAAFSLLAYLWLVLIVEVISPQVIDIWEALVTLLLFPVLVAVSYYTDVRSGEQKPALQRSTPGVEPVLTAREMPALYPDLVKSVGGGPIFNPAGVLTFENDVMEVDASLEQREVTVRVARKNGTRGDVACQYRTEALSAVPGYDYREEKGELRFEHGVASAEIPLTILPKRLWEGRDSFQIILEDAEGGVLFNPNDDGGEESCVLTVAVRNANSELAGEYPLMKAMTCLDGCVNVDSLRLGTAEWYQDIKDAIFEVGDGDEPPSAADRAAHVLALPWKLLFALLAPPPEYCGGWICFYASLVHIGWLTAVIIDFAELFGCIAGIDDSITAITFVALGTSMPDLFASRTAAVEDETADASIVNVTGSNSVNVFLGIGIPWSISAIYWAVQGPDAKWKKDNSDLLGAYPDGAFVVRGGALTFGVMVFTVGAVIALTLLRLRRSRLGGELGGPFHMKVLSAMTLGMLWLFYIGLSVWQTTSKVTDLGEQATTLLIAMCVLENVVLALGLGLFLFAKSKSGREAGDIEEGSVDGECPPPPAAPHEAPRCSLYASRVAEQPPGHIELTGSFPRGHFQRQPPILTPHSSTDTTEWRSLCANLHSAGPSHGAPFAGRGPVQGFPAPVVEGKPVSFGGAAMTVLAATRFKKALEAKDWESDCSDMVSCCSGGSAHTPAAVAHARPTAPGAQQQGASVINGWLRGHLADFVTVMVAAMVSRQVAN